MKGFFRGNTFRLMVTLVVALTAVVILSITAGDTTVKGFFQALITPMQSAAAGTLSDDDDSLGLKSMTRSELEAYAYSLADENASLRQTVSDYYDLKQKNEQYEQAMKLTTDDDSYSFQVASVISRDPTDVFCGFSLDVGSVDGIEINDPVICSQGLVGVVSEVYATSCRVRTIYDDELYVGAVCEETDENGIITSTTSSANSETVIMRYLTRDTKVSAGSIITTSGYGGVFPKGLVIGTVESVGSSDKDVTYSAVVKPSADIRNVSNCFVITEFSGQGEGTEVSLFESQNNDDGEAGEDD